MYSLKYSSPEKRKRKKDVWVLQATVDYTGHLENLSVDYKSHHVPASLSPSGYSVQTSAGNGLQIPSIFQSYRVRPTQIVEMDHSSLISLYTPLSDPWTTLQSTFTTLLTLCFDIMRDDFSTGGVSIIEICHQFYIIVNRGMWGAGGC